MSWEGGEEFKPDWDTFFMAQAFVVSQRSVDKSTVHGSCLVSKDNRLLAIGYNGPLRRSVTNPEDLEKRPNKYWLMIHSEENCVLNYHGSHSDLEGSTMYITGEPCHRCLRTILQKGIKRIVYGHVGCSIHCIDEEDREAKRLLLESVDTLDVEACGKFTDDDGVHHKTFYHKELHYYKFEQMDKVKTLLKRTLDYIDHKEDQNG